MLDKRGRDIGEPTGKIIRIPPTPELVAQTRANFVHVLEDIFSKRNGYPTKVTVYWDGIVPDEDLPLLREYEKRTGYKHHQGERFKRMDPPAQKGEYQP